MLVLLFILGLAVISAGAELFVRGAARLAAMFGISSLIIGLTVVAFGTSAPEVAVVLQAGLQGQGDMAFGNIIGSNISNFMLILGISALLAPLVVSRRLIRLEVPLLLVISAVVFLAAFDGQISRGEGGLLILGRWRIRCSLSSSPVVKTGGIKSQDLPLKTRVRKRDPLNQKGVGSGTW
jgi:cation:H+ antiporter